MRDLHAVVALGALLVSQTAGAEIGAALRAGTLGIGLELNVGLTQTLNLRLGYSAYDHDDTIEDTDVRYDGEIKLRHPSALLDWHAFESGFRFSFGVVGANTTVEARGEPTNGTYQIGDQVFTAAQVGTLRGEVEMGNSVAPYIGVGWGNTLGKSRRVSFLFDIGAIYMGSPTVNLIGTCGTAAPSGSAACNTLQAEVEAEEDELEDEATLYEWYPVIGLGVSVRF